MSDSRKFDELSNEQMRAVDSVCIVFERALRAGEPVAIERFLESTPNDLQAPVFQELLTIELEWLKSRSLGPDVADYLERFPQRHEEIHGLLQADQIHSLRTERTGIGGENSMVLSRSADLPAAGAIIDSRYTIIEPIGEGGMGTVFLAEQHLPVTRQVAIKFIKGGDGFASRTGSIRYRAAGAGIDGPSGHRQSL